MGRLCWKMLTTKDLPPQPSPRKWSLIPRHRRTSQVAYLQRHRADSASSSCTGNESEPVRAWSGLPVATLRIVSITTASAVSKSSLKASAAGKASACLGSDIAAATAKRVVTDRRSATFAHFWRRAPVILKRPTDPVRQCLHPQVRNTSALLRRLCRGGGGYWPAYWPSNFSRYPIDCFVRKWDISFRTCALAQSPAHVRATCAIN